MIVSNNNNNHKAVKILKYIDFTLCELSLETQTIVGDRNLQQT